MQENEDKVNIDELIQGVSQKEIYLKSLKDISFQEQKLISQMASQKHLLQFFTWIFEHEQTKNKIYKTMLDKQRNNQDSILGMCYSNRQLFRDEHSFVISHKHISSRGLLLALYLNKELKTKVDLVTCDKSLKGVGHIIADQKEVDRLGFARETAGKQGVIIHDIHSWEEHPWIQDDSVVVVDLFGLNPIEYRPFVLKHSQQLQKAKKIAVYHSHLQDDEISAQTSGLQRLNEAIPLQLWPQHPIQTLVEKDAQVMYKNLITFLKEESDQPQKQDVVIFVPAQTSIKRFSSKINQLLCQNQLRDGVHIITKINESYSRSKNHIFLVRDSAQLIEWDYDYCQLFYAIDFQNENSYRFDYELAALVHHVSQSTGEERARRMALVGSTRIGRYSCLSSQVAPNIHYTHSAPQLSTYILKMVEFGISDQLQMQSKRVQDCLNMMQSMKIIKKENNSFTTVDKKVVDAAKEGINPIQAKMVLDVLNDKDLKQHDKLRQANLISIAVNVMWSSLNLHKELVGTEQVYRKNGQTVWKQSGYIEPCLQIFVKCDSIQIKNGQNKGTEVEVIRRLSSKVSEDQSHFFGSLYALCEEAPVSPKQIDVHTFLKHNQVNEQAYYDIRSKVEQMRQFFQINPLNFILQKQDLNLLFKRIVSTLPQSLAYFSGLKRIGYKFQQVKVKAQLAPQTLLAKTGEHPQYLYVTGLTHSKNTFFINSSNTFNQESLMEWLGRLPMKQLQSHGQAQLQFHGISTAAFEQLVLNKQSTITKFEEEHDCSIDLKHEMNMVVLHCSRQRGDKIKASFSSLLDKIRERINSQKKLIHYLGKTNIIMETGGRIQDIFRQKYIDKCTLSNIDPEVTKQDLQELFQQFFVLKEITLNECEPHKNYKTALIHFYSQKDYHRFYQYYNNCPYYDLQLEVKPIRDQEKKDNIKPQQFIQFRWFVWQSCGRALVKFQTIDAAARAMEGFKANPKLDGCQVVPQCSGNQITIQKLNPVTDQIFLRDALKGYGPIASVQILRYPLREETNPDNYIQNLIKKVNKPNNQFRMGEVKKQMNGMRTCTVTFTDNQFMLEVLGTYNQKAGILGQGRLYTIPTFQKPILIPTGLTPLYQSILQQCMQQSHAQTLVIKQLIKDEGLEYIILRSNQENMINNLYRLYVDRLKPQKIQLNKNDKEVIFNQFALSTILYLEDTYCCKMVIDLIYKQINFIATRSAWKRIKDEVRERLVKNFYYMLRVSSRTYKHLFSNKDILAQVQQEHKLARVDLQLDSYQVLLSGPIQNIQSAITYFMHIAESLQATEEAINPDVCGICCQKFTKPYRLQKCSHLFCSNCLKQYYRSMLSDVSLFPAKCPQCSQLVVLKDLQANLTKQEWQKLKTLGLNKFMGSSGDKFSFCYTPGCKQINFIEGPSYLCDTCKIQYCNLCKQTIHPGIKCENVMEIRQSDEYFKRYMLQSGGRFCANPSCKMPVVKIDGCDRITCSRCNMSMCFKCPPDKMIPYEDAQDCYDHLDQVHGGYF